jgi:hypothetical protein
LCAHDTVRDREKAMQVVIAVVARQQEMIGILDHERLVRASDEVDEDLVTLQRLPIGGVHHLRLIVSLRQSTQDRSHESSLACARRSLQDQHRVWSMQIVFDELLNRLAEGRIRLIVDRISDELVECGASQRASPIHEVPVQRKHLLARVALADDTINLIAQVQRALLACGPNCEPA